MQVRLLDPELYAGDLFAPKHPADAGIDLRSAEDRRVHSGETLSLGLGVAVAVPSGHVGWLTGRSTTVLKMGLHVSEGKIDAGYRGEVHCFVTAQGSPVEIARGDRICQLVVVKIQQGWTIVDELDEGDGRDQDGLGSTGLR